MSILCSMVGASFVTAVAEVIRRKKGITALGNAQIDTAQSKFGGASALFDGTTDYIDTNTTSDFAFGTSQYTIEGWLRLNSTGKQHTFFDIRVSGGNDWVIYVSSSNKLEMYTGSTETGTTNLTTGVWYHIAIVRDSTNLKVYLNGTQEFALTAPNIVTNRRLRIGGGRDGGDYPNTDLTGWMDEIRVSNNARYTAAFTAPTAPFVNDANTLLLIHADGTDAVTYFEDDNGVRAQVGITAVATAQVDTAQSKFGGASLLLDGDSDYLSVLSSDGTFNFGTSEDFTIECWIRATTVDEYHTVIASNNSSYASSAVTFTGGATAQKLRMNIQGIGNVLIDSTALSANTWYHVAVTRSGSSWNLWRDGTSVSSNTNSGWTVNFEGNGGFNIGWTRWDGAVAYWTGYIDEFRISSIARYTGTFTPSTTPFVNDATTLLLIHADGTDASTVFRDDNGTGRSQKGITALGNAQIDTAQSQFSGASALFDGTGDYLSLDANSDLNFGTNNWTIEFYYRITGSADQTIFANGGGSFDSNAWAIAVGASGTKLGLFSGNVASPYEVAIESLPSQSVWYHLAFVRNGNTISYYRDGVLKSSSTYTGSINWNYNNKTYVGYSAWNGVDASGWMDELRISNNARYTAGFTPSTTPFQNDANTLLLMHMDGTDASTVFTDDNGKTPT